MDNATKMCRKSANPWKTKKKCFNKSDIKLKSDIDSKSVNVNRNIKK